MVKHKKNPKAKGHKKPSKYHLAQLRHLRRVRALYEHNAATGIALISPFAVIIAISLLYRLSIPESDSLARFYDAWIFNPLVVMLWAVVFPLLALLINLGSVITIIKDHRYNGKIRPHSLMRDLWPSLGIVLFVLIAFTIVFGGGLNNIASTLQTI